MVSAQLNYSVCLWRVQLLTNTFSPERSRLEVPATALRLRKMKAQGLAVIPENIVLSADLTGGSDAFKLEEESSQKEINKLEAELLLDKMASPTLSWRNSVECLTPICVLYKRDCVILTCPLKAFSRSWKLRMTLRPVRICTGGKILLRFPRSVASCYSIRLVLRERLEKGKGNTNRLHAWANLQPSSRKGKWQLCRTLTLAYARKLSTWPLQ